MNGSTAVLLATLAVMHLLHNGCNGFFISTTTAAVARIARPVAPPRATSIGDRWRGFYPSHVLDLQHPVLEAAASPDNGNDSSRDGGIDLNSAMANARANLAAGTSPGAGLESAFDQADAAYADLIVTSVDSQRIGLNDEDVEELAKGGTMDETSTSRKSKGLLGDMSDILGALSKGAHIVKRDDGTL